MKYLITYDLNRPGQYYKTLFEAIESLGRWCHILQNTWVVKSSYTVVQTRDHLSKFIDSNDKLFICGVDNWASYNMQEVTDWLKIN